MQGPNPGRGKKKRRRGGASEGGESVENERKSTEKQKMRFKNEREWM